jgi:hypothetical protein
MHSDSAGRKKHTSEILSSTRHLSRIMASCSGGGNGPGGGGGGGARITPAIVPQDLYKSCSLRHGIVYLTDRRGREEVTERSEMRTGRKDSEKSHHLRCEKK